MGRNIGGVGIYRACLNAQLNYTENDFGIRIADNNGRIANDGEQYSEELIGGRRLTARGEMGGGEKLKTSTEAISPKRTRYKRRKNDKGGGGVYYTGVVFGM